MPVRDVRVGGEGDLLDRLRPVGRALDEEARRGSHSRSSSEALEQVRRDRAAPSRAARARSTAVAAPATGVERLAYVPRPYGVLSVSPSCTSTSSGGMPSSSATIWANVVSWPWPCDLTPSLRIALPVGWTRSSAESNMRSPTMSYVLAGPGADDLGEATRARSRSAVPPRAPPPAPRAAPRSRASRARGPSPPGSRPSRRRSRSPTSYGNCSGLMKLSSRSCGRVDAELVRRGLRRAARSGTRPR